MQIRRQDDKLGTTFGSGTVRVILSLDGTRQKKRSLNENERDFVSRCATLFSAGLLRGKQINARIRVIVH